MGPRLRKFIGGPLILLILAGWIWLAVSIGERLPQVWWALLPFYALAGMGWGLPVMPLMRWMNGGGEAEGAGVER